MPLIETKIFAPRRRVISWAPSGWLQTGMLGSTGTSFSMVSCPDDFFAVRLGFANILPEPYRVQAIGAASNTSADMINPTGPASWVPFTFANGGADSERIATSRDAAGDIVVHGNSIDPSSGETAIPRWSWTDWVPLASLVRVDMVGGPRILMVRVLHPSGTTITQTNGQFIGYTGVPKLNKGFDYGMGWADGDHVTVPHPVFHGLASPGNAAATVGCFQFLTKNAGIVGMIAGDSHHEGTTTTTQFNNCLLQSTVSLGSHYIGRIPFGMVNVARGGAASQLFFPRLQALLSAVRPSFVVLPGWTFNETNGPVHADATANDIFLARLLGAAESVRSVGAVPIFLTPFPRDRYSMTPTQLVPWLALRRTILDLRKSGDIVIDATNALGRRTGGELNGTYLDEMTTDGIHPNDTGHAALATDLQLIIQNIAGLGPATPIVYGRR